MLCNRAVFKILKRFFSILLLAFRTGPLKILLHATTNFAMDIVRRFRVFLVPRIVKGRRILIGQVRPLGPAGSAEIFDLHHGWQYRLIGMIFQCRFQCVSLKFLNLKKYFKNNLITFKISDSLSM